MRRSTGKVIAVLATAAVLTACGSSSGGSSTGGSGTGGTASASGKFSKPLKIGILFEVPGESSVAVADYANVGELAVKNLNAAGGVGGQQVETKRMPVSALDPQKAASDFLAMVDWKPDVIIGFPGSTIDAVIPQITRAGIPVLTPVEDQTTLKGSNSGSDYLWILPPVVTSVPQRAAQYIVQDAKASKIAEINTNESYGLNSSAAFNAQVKTLGSKVDSQQKISPTATDLTSQVLGINGADWIAAWIYPNEFGVLDKQLKQNGKTAKIMGSGSAELAFGFGLLKVGATAGDYYATLGCNPENPAAGSALATVVSDYKAAYPKAAVPFSQAISAYDGVFIAAKAAEAAGSTDPKAINDQLDKVTYTGACGDYKADGAHVMGHSLQIVHFGKTVETVKTYQNTPLASAADANKTQ
ncbi:MAG: branched-chain amino acid transporter substrate-binding protein [Mycobacterium sp.]|nr:branched-chain amino acid transporter substrate-binding protein [Mycobacterium sp.]